MKLKDILIGASIFFSLSGCNSWYPPVENYFVKGEVVDEKYEESKLENYSNEHLFSTTETLILGDSKYNLKVKSNSKIYSIQVKDGILSTKEDFNKAVNVGDKVEFSPGETATNGKGQTRYYSKIHDGKLNCLVGSEIRKIN